MTREKKKTHSARWLLSLLAGMLITLAACQPSYKNEGKNPAYAWWGTMYPQYCFSADTEDCEESVPIKIDFRWLRIK